MMRKYIWTGTAVAVLGIAGTYLAADHSVRYPDSFLGRCAGGFKSFAPVFGYGETDKTHAANTQVATAPKSLPKPSPPEMALEPFVVEAVEIIPSVEANPPFHNFEESDAPSPAMPLCPEDDDAADRRMPYADQDDNAEDNVNCQELFDFVGKMLWGPFFSGPTMPQAEGESDMKSDAEENEDFPELRGFREDPHRDHHYPSCPYTGSGRSPLPRIPYQPPMAPAEPGVPNTATPGR